MQIILASQSPRRKALLSLFGLPFAVRVANIDEAMDPNADLAQEVARVSREKAQAIAHAADDIVIAADTIVVLEGNVLGKPRDAAHAKQMLSALSGKDHQVMTGVTVSRGDQIITHTEITDLHFRPLSEKEIDRYVDTGEPMDKAGAYGIQGGAALFVQWLRGDYYNVMGLPVCKLYEMLSSLAPELMEDMP